MKKKHNLITKRNHKTMKNNNNNSLLHGQYVMRFPFDLNEERVMKF